jgi:hypothetical protein
MKRELTASIVFSSMTVFDMLQQLLHVAVYFVNNLVNGRVSIDRINDFLQNVSHLREAPSSHSAHLCLTDRTPRRIH